MTTVMELIARTSHRRPYRKKSFITPTSGTIAGATFGVAKRAHVIAVKVFGAQGWVVHGPDTPRVLTLHNFPQLQRLYRRHVSTSSQCRVQWAV